MADTEFKPMEIAEHFINRHIDNTDAMMNFIKEKDKQEEIRCDYCKRIIRKEITVNNYSRDTPFCMFCGQSDNPID